MINKISISNLKSINELTISPKLFNMFTGTNSSGKSTTIQALLLAAQNLESPFGLNGPLTSIGEYRDAKNYNVKKETIEINLSNENSMVSIALSEDTPPEISTNGNLIDSLNYANNNFHYLSCNRVGSKDLFFQNRTIYHGVGITGEYAIAYLSEHGNDPLDEEIVRDSSNFTLTAQVNYWLRYIVNASIKVETVTDTDAVKAQYGIVDGRYSRPQNVGSGISYLISIIIMCLSSNRDDIIVIENPEIHLHPLSQSKLCEFLYYISQSGRQLFIETHSDHFLNAIRVGIATKQMNKEDVLVEFFKLGSDNCTRKYDIEIGPYGAIENQIPHFFDQFQIDMDRMIGGYRDGSNNQ